MVGLRHVATLAGRSDMTLATVSDLLISEEGYLIALTRSEGGMFLFDIGGSGAPSLLQTVSYRSVVPMAGFGPTAELLVLPDGTTLLMPAGMTGSPSSAYFLTASGQFGASIRWESGLNPAMDMALVTDIAGWDTAAYIAVLSDGTLQPVTLTEGRRYSAEMPEPFTSQLGGAVSSLDTIATSGGTFLITASSFGQSLVTYRVSDGLQLQQIDLVSGPQSGIGFSSPSALETVTVSGENYVILASSGSSSLTVFRLLQDGSLVATDHIVDSRESRFQSVSVLEVLQAGDHVFVLAAGADDGLSLFLLLPGGSLLHLGSYEDTESATLGAISAIAAGWAADGMGQIYVASSRDPGLTRLSLEINTGIVLTHGPAELLGTPRDDVLMASGTTASIHGGAGDDIVVSASGPGGRVRLTGGTGDDVFVILPGARVTTITDFELGSDRLDLSNLPMLRDVSQIGFTSTAHGISLTFGSSVIEIVSADGRPLAAADFRSTDLLPISRYLPGSAIAAPTGRNVVLGDNGGSAQGADGDDTLRGGGGNDTLRGEGGDDRIEACGGNDNIGGGAGNDLILVLSGSNMIWGGLGDDSIEGGTGADTIYGGGVGRNRLMGNGGNDVLFAGSGGDFIGGGAGNDFIRGGDGSDTIFGGADDDNIGGGAGDDLIFASSGRNIIWGGLGNDTLNGALGSDTLQGGAGSDQIFGDGGNDFLLGEDGNDTIWAGQGNDFVGGGAGDDVMYATNGVNRIYGGVGNDTIHAGLGRDVMTGSPGADVFVFSDLATIGIGTGRDVITDFTPGSDKIDLRDLDQTFNGVAGLIGGGHSSFYFFAPAGLLIGDQDGDGVADWVIQLIGSPMVTATDFLL
ncbi:calcium-binding protein [Thioclava sp. FR2]|uniref:calcium-binding protein n=1 Tax=Thioclava sp. FR2 TaxID=3445780 RepID=UPI003EC0FECA